MSRDLTHQLIALCVTLSMSILIFTYDPYEALDKLVLDCDSQLQKKITFEDAYHSDINEIY